VQLREHSSAWLCQLSIPTCPWREGQQPCCSIGPLRLGRWMRQKAPGLLCIPAPPAHTAAAGRQHCPPAQQSTTLAGNFAPQFASFFVNSLLAVLEAHLIESQATKAEAVAESGGNSGRKQHLLVLVNLPPQLVLL
jgi:hypothetical protein